MRNKKLIRIISAALVGASLSAFNIKNADADWKSDNNGWWYSEGDSWSLGWRSIDGKWYYFNIDGYMVTGWKMIDNKWYFFAGDGSMSTGLLKAADGDYYLDESGALRTGWFKIGEEWHYYNEDGTIKNGWLSYNSKWYYIKDGTMLKNTVIDGYEIDNNGEWIQKKSRAEQLKNESEEAKKVKESILKEDSIYINKFKDFDFNLGLAEEKNTKDLLRDYSNIPEEKCYQIAVYMDEDEDAFASYFYVVGLESKKIYATASQGGCDIYEIKDNKIDNTFYYKNDENTSVEWRGMPINETDESYYIKRNIARYDGEYLKISKTPVKELKAKSSITMEDAVQLAVKNDSKMLYSLKNAGGVIVDINKGSEIKYTDTKEKWAIPEGGYYLFDVSGSTASGRKLADYSYMVSKDTKDVYLIPRDEKHVAYKMENNIKAETYKPLNGGSNTEWR